MSESVCQLVSQSVALTGKQCRLTGDISLVWLKLSDMLASPDPVIFPRISLRQLTGYCVQPGAKTH